MLIVYQRNLAEKTIEKRSCSLSLRSISPGSISTKMTDFLKTTEQTSNHDHLEKMSVGELLKNINAEDKKVALAVEKTLPAIEKLTMEVVKKLKNGGRLFYIGAGTSGRLGILDASECPPTFGVPAEMVIGIIAGGDRAIRNAVEFAEDSKTQAWNDLQQYSISEKDIVVGIAASGTTPYVVGALEKCNDQKIITGCITCNQGRPLAKTAQYPIKINVGNKMVDMQLSNEKLLARGAEMIVNSTGISISAARKLLKKHGNVRSVINDIQNVHKTNQ